jgi:hypothetical protein
MGEKFHVHAETTQNYTRLCFNQILITAHKTEYTHAQTYTQLQIQASVNVLLLIPKPITNVLVP